MKQLTTNKSGWHMVAVTGLALFLAVSCGNGQKAENSTATTDNKEANELAYSESDLSFLRDVVEINQKEILLGQLAQERAMSSEVKDLGRMMEDSHKKCAQELTDLMNKKSIHLTAVSADNSVAVRNKLNEKTGKEFDKDYSDMMVKGHKEAIEKFEKASSDCKDGDVRAFASATLPELHKHLDHAEVCKEKCDKKN